MKYLKIVEGDEASLACVPCFMIYGCNEIRMDSIHKEEHMELFRCECQWCGEEFRVEIYTDERHMKGEKMITKVFGKDFDSDGGALTLDPYEVSDVGGDSGTHTRVHADGWSITGEIHEDYYVWVNYFEAKHPTYGEVKGDFEEEVTATSEEAFAHFYTNHAPEAWDYGDI